MVFGAAADEIQIAMTIVNIPNGSALEEEDLFFHHDWWVLKIMNRVEAIKKKKEQSLLNAMGQIKRFGTFFENRTTMMV